MKRILNKREKIMLSVTLGVALFGVAFHFVISPTLKKSGQLNKEINVARLRLAKYARLLAQKEDIRAKYNGVSSALSISGQKDTRAVSGLLDLEKIAKQANIRIADIRPQAPKETGAYKEIAIDMRTEGSMQDYMKFIYDIEHSLSLFTIKKLKLNNKPNTRSIEGAFTVSQIFSPGISPEAKNE